MNNTYKTIIGAALLMFMMAANFQNAFNEYGIKTNVFMNGIVASESGSGSDGTTKRDCNEEGGNPFYYCTKAPKTEICTLYKSIDIEGSYSLEEPKGKLKASFVKVEGNRGLCPDSGSGCKVFSCTHIRPDQPGYNGVPQTQP